MPTSSDYERMLRAAGLRVIRPRLAVLSVVHDRPHADVDGAVGDTACLTAPDASGYDVGEAEVIYWGRCPECVAASTSGG